ncbi:MAG: ubiquitin-like domain-containing protein [Jatrophihabitans sp.]
MLRSIKYGLYGAVIAGLIAAPVVWSSVDRTVHVNVDGQSTSFRTTAGSVGEALSDHGLHADNHDLLAPSASSKITDGMEIVLRRGRLLHLQVDGRSIEVWTTYRTVQSALAALGYSTQDFVSVSRSRRLPLGPTDISIRTPRSITVIHDGITQTVLTTEPTVGQMLDEIGVRVGANDTLSVPANTNTVQGQVITLERVERKSVTSAEALAFRTSRQNDPNLDKGSTRVVTPGRDGKVQVTYLVVYVDGVVVTRTKVKAVTVAEPRTKVLAVGTRQVIVIRSPGDTASQSSGGASVPSAPVPSPGSAKAIARELLAGYGWGDQEYSCLVQMWNRESGWRVSAANPSGAYGIPQALPGSKMSSAGPNWQTSARTQIAWGLGYIKARYSTPCGAWSFWQGHNYY